MKTMTKTIKGGKSLDLFISKISSNDILNIDEMICIRGGQGDDINYPVPPVPPKETEINNSSNIICK